MINLNSILNIWSGYSFYTCILLKNTFFKLNFCWCINNFRQSTAPDCSFYYSYLIISYHNIILRVLSKFNKTITNMFLIFFRNYGNLL